MTRPTISEINVSTNETIIREMDDIEYAAYLEAVKPETPAE